MPLAYLSITLQVQALFHGLVLSVWQLLGSLSKHVGEVITQRKNIQGEFFFKLILLSFLFYHYCWDLFSVANRIDTHTDIHRKQQLIFLTCRAEYSLLLPQLYAMSSSYYPIKETLARNIISMRQRLVSDKLE